MSGRWRVAGLGAWAALAGAAAGCTTGTSVGGLEDASSPSDAAEVSGADDAGPDAANDAGAVPDAEPAPPTPFMAESAAVASAGQAFLADEPVRLVPWQPVHGRIHGLAEAGGSVWVAAELGLFEIETPESDSSALGELAPAAWFDATTHGDPVALVAAGEAARPAVATTVGLVWPSSGGDGDVDGDGDGAVVFAPYPSGVEGPKGRPAWVAETLWVGSELGLVRWDGVAPPELVPATRAPGGVLDVITDGQGGAWLLTPGALLRLDGALALAPEPVELGLPDGAGALRALALAEEPARPFVLADEVVGWPTEGGWQWLDSGLGGLPTAAHRAVAAGGGRVVVGHAVGASGAEAGGVPGRWDHWGPDRWIDGAPVEAVLVAASGDVWLGAETLTRVRWEERTLAGKAAAMETLLVDGWDGVPGGLGGFVRMDGFVASDGRLDDPWQPTSWTLRDKDNDGLWTQMQIGAWCHAYAATGDEAFYERARAAIDVMLLQIRIPALTFEAAGLAPGFITRSLVRDDEGEVFDDKAARDNWHLQAYEGRDYFWKDDTSSDEYVGHFYGYPLFYDLCAKDDAERQEIADAMALAMDYVVDGGLVLVDLDGEPTLHGHWQPERIAAAAHGLDACLDATDGLEDPDALFQAVSWCAESWHGGGWLNSLEILGHLLATYHVTGEVRFLETYDTLIEVHAYDLVAMPHAETVTITQPSFMNHSDHELAMLAYHSLIRYEPDVERRAWWVESLRFLHEHELVERNPLWQAIWALAHGVSDPDDPHALAAVQSLREFPLDRRELRVDNIHRLDVEPWPNDRFDQPQGAGVYPYDEIRSVWWNGNLHVLTHGGDGRGVSGPMAYLLPYWALRHAGVLAP